jgi:hypothetical protein
MGSSNVLCFLLEPGPRMTLLTRDKTKLTDEQTEISCKTVASPLG